MTSGICNLAVYLTSYTGYNVLYTDNGWQYMTIVVSGGTQLMTYKVIDLLYLILKSIFKDGIRLNDATIQSPYGKLDFIHSGFFLGIRNVPNLLSNRGYGYVAELRIWNRVLTHVSCIGFDNISKSCHYENLNLFLG
jgi:hypothetical protein